MIPGLKPNDHRLIRDTLLKVLTTSKQFGGRRAVKTWRAWTGQADDAAPPSVDQAPWVRLTLQGGPVRRLANTSSPGGVSVSQESLVLEVEVYASGTDLGDAWDVWDAIFQVFLSDELETRAAVDCALKAGGIRDIRPAASPAWVAEAGAFSGKGSFEVLIHLSS